MKRNVPSATAWPDWDDGLTASGRADLGRATARDPELAADLDAHLRLEALLVAAHDGEPSPDMARLCEAIRRRAGGLKSRVSGWTVLRIGLAAAALLLALLGGGLWVRHARRMALETVTHRLTAGALLRDPDAMADQVPNGRLIRTAPDSRARLTLHDGSTMELGPASQAEVAIPSHRGVREVRLLAGAARFQVVAADRRFRVITPVGVVTVKGTEFTVELEQARSTGGANMRGEMVAIMAVAVLTGSVEVQVGGRVVTLGAGQTQAFAGEGRGESSTLRSESFGGVVVSADAASVTVERRGDGGVGSTRTIALGAGTRVRIEGVAEEEVAGEGGRLKKQRQLTDGTAADLVPGKHIKVKISNDMATEIVVRSPKNSGGGESSRPSETSTSTSRSESRSGGEVRVGGESRKGGESREGGAPQVSTGGRTEGE